MVEVENQAAYDGIMTSVVCSTRYFRGSESLYEFTASTPFGPAGIPACSAILKGCVISVDEQRLQVC